ncbi:MAG TPA: hypothetical protein VM889_08060 [Candidatus Thermoplasmatota archaeon]|nr:hypothetical protein [Candidatus Thermoplasmatota archaeon]
MNPLTKKLAAAVLAVAFALPMGAVATNHTPCPNNRPYYDSTVLESQSQWQDPKARNDSLRSLVVRFDKDTNRELEPGKTVYLWTLVGYTAGPKVSDSVKDQNGRPVQEPKPNTENLSRFKGPTNTGMWYVESNGLAGFQPLPNQCLAPDGVWVTIYHADTAWSKAPLA